jgi:hypothetical protein
MASLFEKLNEGRPPEPSKKVVEQQDDLKIVLMKVLTQPLNPKRSPAKSS